MELSTATFHTTQRQIDPNEVLKGEVAAGAQNIQAVTLYAYPKTFIVAFLCSNLLFIAVLFPPTSLIQTEAQTSLNDS